MNADELLKDLARRFAALGAKESDALYYLTREASSRLSRILDKYSRFIPVDQEVKGFRVRSVFLEGDAFCADIVIDSGGSLVPAAKVTYDPAAA